jgi:FkbM family methyltransferase
MRDSMHSGLKRRLRSARGGIANAIAALVDTWPPLERPFIVVGSRAARWHWPGTLYWESHQALMRRLRASGRPFRTVSVMGHALLLDVTDGSVSMRYFHDQPYEPHLTALIADTMRDGSVFIDVGANTGFFTMLAGRCAFPRGRVLAFEPHPAARAQMVRALALNGLGEVVTVSDAALSDQPAPAARLFTTTDSVLSTLDPALAPLGDEYSFLTSVEVPVSTLDNWLDTAGPEWMNRAIDLIKIDVEGVEERVLRGMTRTLDRNPSLQLVCETHAGSPADRLLQSAGFSVQPLDISRPGFGNFLYARPR